MPTKVENYYSFQRSQYKICRNFRIYTITEEGMALLNWTKDGANNHLRQTNHTHSAQSTTTKCASGIPGRLWKHYSRAAESGQFIHISRISLESRSYI